MFQCVDERESDKKLCSANWIAGTFLPPSNAVPLLPTNIVTSPNIDSPNRSLGSKYEIVILEDGKEVMSKYIKIDNYKNRKRDRPEEARSSKKKE